MVCDFESEIVITSFHLQGLLWRNTEEISEVRSPDLVNGLFARLDYVSYFAQEVAFSVFASKQASVSFTTTLLLNFVGNHLLNLSCTLADSGMVGAILWSFELREITVELSEDLTGARFHSSHSSALSWGDLEVSGASVALLVSSITELLSNAVTGIRVARSRLLGNLLLTSAFTYNSGVSGQLLTSSGLSEHVLSEHGDLSSSSELFVGGSSACSLVRHFSRLRQMTSWNALALQNSSEMGLD